MRLRPTLAAVCGALALSAVLAAPADAATGDFKYLYHGETGVRGGELHDPAPRTCINIPEATDPGSSSPAFGPYNTTDSPALVFDGPDCAGAYHPVPVRGPVDPELTFRSVYFLN